MTTTNELPKDAWDAVLAAGEEREYRRGAWIFVEGDPPGPALAVIEGEVRVEATREGFAVELGLFGVGSLFGELSAIDGRPRSASAIATETTRLAAVGIPEFNQLLTQHPTLAAALLRVMIRSSGISTPDFAIIPCRKMTRSLVTVKLVVVHFE